MKRSFIIRPTGNREQVKQGLWRALKALDVDKPWQIDISPYKENKTGEQRAFFHVLLGYLSRDTGHTIDELKLHMKADTFGTMEKTINGVENIYVKSSELAKRAEYSALIETTYREAAQMGIVLPPPQRKYNEPPLI